MVGLEPRQIFGLRCRVRCLGQRMKLRLICAAQELPDAVVIAQQVVACPVDRLAMPAALACAIRPQAGAVVAIAEQQRRQALNGQLCRMQ